MGGPKSEVTQMITWRTRGELFYVMAQARLQKLYVMMRNMLPPELFYAMSDPIHYTDKVGVPSILSSCAMDCMRII